MSHCKYLLLLALVITPKIGRAEVKEANADVLSRIWKIGSEKFCSKERQAEFNKKNFDAVLAQANSPADRRLFEEALNPFLFSLGWSHTEFLSPPDEGYYFFKSHVAMTNPKVGPAPKIINPGVQIKKDHLGWFVKEVLDGFPAQAAGIKKMDRIASVDGVNFIGDWGRKARLITVGIDRQGKRLEISVQAPALNWSESFQKASKSSIRIFNQIAGKKIGYIHLWSGTHPQSATLLQKSVASFQREGVSGVILDLRGGYGGAWWDHLDPFFADTSTYMEMEVEKPDGGKQVLRSPFKTNKNAFGGPLVVLINDGVRSGKEALAYQFKKTKRAYLIGEKTPGYFSTGQYFFAEEPKDYILYMCVFKNLLDGNQIEGVGVEPDQAVPFLNESEFGDSQLKAAFDFFKSRR